MTLIGWPKSSWCLYWISTKKALTCIYRNRKMIWVSHYQRLIMKKEPTFSLQWAHYRLTLLATLCAFIATSIIGGSFIWAKYLNEYRLSLDAFDRESQMIWQVFQRVSNPRDMARPNMRRNIHDTSPPPRESIGIIRLSWSWDIASIDVPERILSSNLEKIIAIFQDGIRIWKYTSGWNATAIEEKEWYFFRVFQAWHDTLLIFSRSAYDKDDLINDLLYFLLVNFLFILPFALISSSLIRRILTPVRKNIDEMEAFIHDAGHELKTPLAIANGNLQLLSKTYKENEEIQHAQEAIRYADHLISTLVELSSLEKRPKNISCNIGSILSEQIKHLEESRKEKSVEIDIKNPCNVMVRMSPEHAEILVHNLVENAIKYNVSWWKIFIELTEKALTIRDTWVGIKKEHQTKIFDRFYRVNHTQQNGHGIGLALVAKICSIYHMKISVESDEWRGSTFKITF